MKVVVFCNVGTRDVLINGKTVYPGGVRDKGQQLLANWQDNAETLDFPIIKPTLDYVLTQTGQIDRLVFFGTDQVDEEHRSRDTLHFAELASLILPQEYEGKLGEVTSQRIEGINPSRYDAAYQKYGEYLKVFLDDTVKSYYLLPTGGIPACATAMLLQGVRLFGDRCRVIYKSETSDAWPLRVGKQMMDIMNEKTAVHLLGRYDFGAAYSLLADRVSPMMAHLLQYGRARLWFDFVEAQKHLSEAMSHDDGNAEEPLRQQRENMVALHSDESLPHIGELYHNARIAWENGRFIDFLGRLHRFQNAVLIELLRMEVDPTVNDTIALERESHYRKLVFVHLRQLVQEETQLTYELTPEQRTILKNILHDNFSLSELNALCFDLGIDYEAVGNANNKVEKVPSLIDYARRHGRMVELVSVARDKRPFASWWPEEALHSAGFWQHVVPAVERIENLMPLYEQSIIAQGLKGVSEGTIIETYQKNGEQVGSPVRDMTIVCRALGLSTENPFQAVRDLIISRL